MRVRHGSSILGSKSNMAVPEVAVPEVAAPEAMEPTVDGRGATVSDRPRTPLHLMSPLRIGFLGTLGVLLAYGLAQAAIQARSVLILLVVALFVALGLNPVVRVLSRHGVKRGLAVLLTVLAVLAVLVLAGFAVVPVFVNQITNLVNSAPSILQDTLRNPLLNRLNQRYQVVSRVQKYISSGGLLQRVFGSLLGAVGVAVGAIFSGVTLLILSLYFLVALPSLKAAIVRLSPASRRDRVNYLTDQIFLRISSYVSGTFLIAVIAGALSYIFLLIVGLGEFALALGVLVAILDIIPLIGATIAALVVVVIGYSQSSTLGLACLIFYVLYQQFENYVVQPRVLTKAVDVPGVLVVIAALVGGALLGITGALLAVPVAAVALLILREVAQPKLDAS